MAKSIRILILIALAIYSIPARSEVFIKVTYKDKDIFGNVKSQLTRYFDTNLVSVGASVDCNENICINSLKDVYESTGEFTTSVTLDQRILLKMLERGRRIDLGQEAQIKAIKDGNAAIVSLVEKHIAGMRADLAKRIADIPKDLARDDASYTALKARLQEDLAQVFASKP